MPTRHGGSCMNQDSTFERRSARRTTTVPCSSTACSWKTPFARSAPTVLIFCMDGSRVLVSAIQLWHIDAGRGPSTPSLREAKRRSNPADAAMDCFAALAMTVLASHGKDGRARRLAPFEIAMRLRRVLQRVGLVDGNLDGAAGDDVEELLRHGDEIRALGGVGVESWPREVERALAGEDVDVERLDLAGRRAE